MLVEPIVDPAVLVVVEQAVADAAATDDSADDEVVPDGPAEQIEALVGDAVAGSIKARDALLSIIHPMVLRYCRARLGRQECVVGAAEDVAQDVCLAVVRALPNYTVKGLSFRAFVYGIAAHKVTDAFRAIGRNRSEPVPDVPDSVSAAEGPEHRALAVELGERLAELLHTLTPRQREVIVLRVAVGLSAEETAHAVGSTPGAVRVTQHRALTRLRQVLVEHEAAALLTDPPLGHTVATTAGEAEPDSRVG
ncbi:RNA polymerase sigma-70 factor [Pseudonocardia sp. N23]|nr:RNA polymerase sigma-70 factor [Pseudonocardia sp. N23]